LLYKEGPFHGSNQQNHLKVKEKIQERYLSSEEKIIRKDNISYIHIERMKKSEWEITNAIIFVGIIHT
jgi:hypothetical protein